MPAKLVGIFFKLFIADYRRDYQDALQIVRFKVFQKVYCKISDIEN